MHRTGFWVACLASFSSSAAARSSALRASLATARGSLSKCWPVSEGLDKLLELSDRLVVMFHGEFVHEACASEADLTETGRHMAGQ